MHDREKEFRASDRTAPSGDHAELALQTSLLLWCPTNRIKSQCQASSPVVRSYGKLDDPLMVVAPLLVPVR